jgi:hypothetical protein
MLSRVIFTPTKIRRYWSRPVPNIRSGLLTHDNFAIYNKTPFEIGWSTDAFRRLRKFGNKFHPPCMFAL